MIHRNSHFVLPLCTLAWLAAAVASSPALAAGKATLSEAQARYQRELVACQSADYIGDRQACRRDAAAARADRAALKDGTDAAQHTRNAMKRCEPLPEGDRLDCRARMEGVGTTTGSAASGGIYRELVTTQPGSASTATSTLPK